MNLRPKYDTCNAESITCTNVWRNYDVQNRIFIAILSCIVLNRWGKVYDDVSSVYNNVTTAYNDISIAYKKYTNSFTKNLS